MRFRPVYTLALICVLAVSLRVVVIPYLANGSNGNPVDVYYVDTEAARLVLGLQDPYLYSHYTNHYGGVVELAYLPLIPLYLAPFALPGADVRYGAVTADVVTVLAIYSISGSLLGRRFSNSWIPFEGTIVFATLPISIWLTGIVGSNVMIGSMFLMVGLTALLRGNRLAAGLCLGLSLATIQFAVILFPIVAAYCLRNRNLKTPVVSILVASAIVLPFLLYSPSKFVYDVLLFQVERPLQQNAIFGLYYLVYSSFGFGPGTYLRATLFLIPAGVVTYLFSNERKRVLIGSAIVGAWGAFVLPVDGFLSYFLLPITISCALIPPVLVRGSVLPSTRMGNWTPCTAMEEEGAVRSGRGGLGTIDSVRSEKDTT
jgi:uncharacterized membrane protein